MVAKTTFCHREVFHEQVHIICETLTIVSKTLKIIAKNLIKYWKPSTSFLFFRISYNWVLARLLDPAFKTTGMSNHGRAGATALLSKTVSSYKTNPVPQSARSNPSMSTPSVSKPATSIRQRRLNEALGARTTSSAVDEVAEYLAAAASELPILLYWKENASHSPNLTRLACDVLAVPSSSV